MAVGLSLNWKCASSISFCLFSVQTALINVLNDIQLNTETGKTSVLVLLYLSAALDTVED